MDEESEDEIEQLSVMYAQEKGDKGDEGTHRFELLRELWSSAP